MIPIVLNETIHISVVFKTWSTVTESSQEEDPVTSRVDVYTDLTSATPTLVGTYSLTQDSAAHYHYDWTPTSTGDFLVQIVGVFADTSQDIINNEFTVSFSPGSTSSQGLGDDYVVEFTGVLDPLYIDPEIIQEFYPEASLAEIAEEAFRVSLQVQKWYPDGDLPHLAYEYMEAAILCSISRKYEGANGSDSVMLGDLMVSNKGAGNTKTRADAGNWCEIAGVLLDDMKRFRAKVRSTRKASTWPNPVAARQLRRKD